MQPSTPIRPVSGTFFEALQVLCPMSAPAPERHSRHSATPDMDRSSVPSDLAIIQRPESPPLYGYNRQYEVASSRTLGRLDTDLSCSPGSPRSPTSTSPVSHPLSAKLMVTRARELLTSRSSKVPKTPEGEKLHGAFCRTKSVVRSFRRSGKEAVHEKNSQDSLRTGSCTVSEEGLDPLERSTISDEPPQIAPLRPVSKFFPDLTIIVPENEIGDSVVVEHVRIQDTDEVASSDHGSLHVAPLRLRSSTFASALEQVNNSAETSFNSAGETSFYYTPTAKEDDDVFNTSDETSQTERPVSKFMAKLQDAMGPDRGYKTPSMSSMTEPAVSPVDTSSPSPKLRHTKMQPQQMNESISLRMQFAKTDPASPTISVPAMWQLSHKETTRDLRIAPSLEKGLHADTLEVFEENAMAKTAALIHVGPDVAEERRSQTLEEVELRDVNLLDQHQSDRDMEVAPLNIAPKARPVRSPSDIGPDYDVSTMPIEILNTIVFSAAWGNADCTELASRLYRALTGPDEGEWDGRKQRLLLQSRLLEELKIMAQYDFLRDDVFEVVRAQIFPTCITEKLSNKDFTNYIRRAVSGYELAELRAEEILELAIVEEDEGFKQTSPEDEIFFQRETFNPQGFVFDASSSDECYERLTSLPSTVGTFEEPEPEPQPRSSWRSLVLSMVAEMFRFGRWRRMS